MKLTNYRTNEDLVAILGALALFLAIIEQVIPKPLPFIKIGLANLPILLSLVLLNPRDIIKLIILKSLGTSLLTGTLFSWLSLYSLAGSFTSGLIMFLTFKLFNKRVSMIGVSVTGAFFNNVVQILIAYLILGRGVIYLGLPILITGLVTGTILGLFANRFIKKSKWIRSLT